MSTSFGSCSICTNGLSFDDISSLKCGHTFHRECVTKWIQQAKNCPKCRAENFLTDITKLYIDEPTDFLAVDIGKFTMNNKKRLANPKGIGWDWDPTKTNVKISRNGLKASTKSTEWQYVFAEKGFDISACRQDHFAGTILYYFEVKAKSSPKITFLIGLSNGNISDNSRIVEMQHLYVYPKNYDYDSCFLSGNRHNFDWPNGIIKPTWNGKGDVVGCGLSLSPNNKLSIFFTGNGILMGKQIPIDFQGNCLIPTIKIGDVSVKANFGDNPAKPFKYDIGRKCPGLGFE